MKKNILIFAAFFLIQSVFCAELSAKFVTVEAAKKDSAEESVEYLKTQIKQISNAAEKRAAYVFLASLQEQLSFYDDAQKSYALAAAISAGDAQDMPKKSNEQIVLDAVRCALSGGDYATADSYLNSAVRNSKNEKIQAYIKLYSQWSALCKANSASEIQDPIFMLQAYSKMDSMKIVRPAVLLTLLYLTGEKIYENQILTDYADSAEAGIIKGDAQLLPTPFWFFVPKNEEATRQTENLTSSDSDFTDLGEEKSEKIAEKTLSPQKSDSNAVVQEDAVKFSKWQLGLFKTEANAKFLAREIIAKGFDAFIDAETRASGTTYYIVLVKEDKIGNVAERLRSAGYDCYAVE